MHSLVQQLKHRNRTCGKQLAYEAKRTCQMQFPMTFNFLGPPIPPNLAALGPHCDVNKVSDSDVNKVCVCAHGTETAETHYSHVMLLYSSLGLCQLTESEKASSQIGLSTPLLKHFIHHKRITDKEAH